MTKMSYSPYRWCTVPECKNTSVKTPGKLWIPVPRDIKMRNIWIKLARRDPKLLSTKSSLYFCEDHFDLEYDMENFMRYKLMGSVKRIKMKPDCIPLRFDCQATRKIRSAPSNSKNEFIKGHRISLIKEIESSLEDHNYVESSSSSNQLSNENIYYHENESDKAVQTAQSPEHKAIQV